MIHLILGTQFHIFPAIVYYQSIKGTEQHCFCTIHKVQAHLGRR
uniref:Uncharacterized protein n=1 Tax=Rhizophora mucronata TaxID=61149 RepID=A0A2P2PZW3_RHIMU